MVRKQNILPQDEEVITTPDTMPVEVLPIAALKPHPKNYRTHPEDQQAHLVESLKNHRFYRNIVIARDNTILAGHGVLAAARSLGITHAPCVRLDLDPDGPQALKVLIGDNELGHMAENDDRLLTELLKEIHDSAPEEEDGLLGTGYDEAMLANLVFVTRPASEVRDHDAAAEWVGMPEYQEGEITLKAMISFRNNEDRERFASLLGLKFLQAGSTAQTLSAWWPPKGKDDLASVRFQA